MAAGVRKIRVLPDPAAVALAAAERIVEEAEKAGSRGTFSIALSGDREMAGVYELLCSEDLGRRIDWRYWEIYLTDEKGLPPTDVGSHFRFLSDALLDRAAISAERIHRIRGEIEPELAAMEYGKLLKQKFGDGGVNVALLTLGGDGHTAGLFPNGKAVAETHHRCVAERVAGLGEWRITMTAPFLNRAANVIVMVCGKERAQCVADALEGPRDGGRCPMQLVGPGSPGCTSRASAELGGGSSEASSGELLWLMDVGAAGMDFAD